MLDLFADIERDCVISIPQSQKRPIAIVGAGAIVDVAHLPAYSSIGLDVAGIFDVNTDRAQDVATRHGVPRVYASIDELLGDDRVDVVDIAIVPWAQPDVVRQALSAGKHLLCQKPLAPSVGEAEELAALAEASGLKVAVNQQLRYDEGMAALRSMLRRGWIGDPTTMSFTVNITTDWTAWSWLVESPRLDVNYHSIHYLDAIRSILGNPTTVFCTGSRTEGQLPIGETRSISTLIFPGDVRAVVHVNHENRSRDPEATFRLDGSEGSIRGSLGLLLDYPHGRPDTLEVFSRTLPTDGWTPYPVTKRWLPDAFAGPMASLLSWIDGGPTAPTAASDNVHTIQLIDALYRSIESGTAQRLGD